MVWGAFQLTAAGSSAGPRGISLWIPPTAGGLAAVFITIIGGCFAFWKSNYRQRQDQGPGLLRRVWRWLGSTLNAGPAWSPTDSWATNVASAGGVLSAVVSVIGSTSFGSALTPDAIIGTVVLFLIFSGTAAFGPLTYGAFAQSPNPAIGSTLGYVWGFLAAAVVTMLAVMGELATLAMLVWQASNSQAGKSVLVMFLGIGALLAATYSIKSIRLIAGIQLAAQRRTVRRSMLGSAARSATL